MNCCHKLVFFFFIEMSAGCFEQKDKHINVQFPLMLWPHHFTLRYFTKTKKQTNKQSSDGSTVTLLNFKVGTSLSLEVHRRVQKDNTVCI